MPSSADQRSDSPGLLFLCVANRARSQMAEGIARHLAGDRLRIFSAGSRPSSVHPMAVEVLREIGIDIAGQRSKPVSEIDPTAIDLVVMLCAEEECPVIHGATERLHWPLPDPDRSGSLEDARHAFLETREALRVRIARLLTERGIL